MAFNIWVKDENGNVVEEKVALNPLNTDSFDEVWEGSGYYKAED